MKDTYLNPQGNLFQRIHACWFLFRHPAEFAQGIINEFMLQARTVFGNQANPVSITPLGDDTPPQENPEIALAVAAEIARIEANNG